MTTLENSKRYGNILKAVCIADTRPTRGKAVTTRATATVPKRETEYSESDSESEYEEDDVGETYSVNIPVSCIRL